MKIQLKTNSVAVVKVAKRNCCGSTSSSYKQVKSQASKTVMVRDENGVDNRLTFMAGVPVELSEYVATTILNLYNRNNDFEEVK